MNRLAAAIALAVTATITAATAFGDDARPGLVVLTPPPPSIPAPSVATLTPPIDLSAYLGRPVTGAGVVLDDDSWPDVVLPKIGSVRIGEPLTNVLARHVLAEVMGSGRFAHGRITVVDDAAGVRLVVHAVARKLIEAIRMDLHGADVDPDELLREADLTDGGELIGNALAKQRRRIEELFARHGYPSATATIDTRGTDDPTRVIVVLDVIPGDPRKIARRAFFLTDASARQLASSADSYAVGTGDRADETLLEAADVKLAQLLTSEGYHRATVLHDVVLAAGVVTLRVRVDAGPRFVPRFVGNDHYDAVALEGALDLPNEMDRSEGRLVQKLKSFYEKRGYLDAEVTIETRGTDADRVHELVFHVVEHGRVEVTSRAYPCLKEAEIKRLTGGGPSSAVRIGSEIDSYLEEELPGADLLRPPDPRGLDLVAGGGRSDVPHGTPVVPVDLDPDATFVAETYDRAILHVQELYRNEGYLHAQVGPVQIVRRKCADASPAGQCIPIDVPPIGEEACRYDAAGLPLPVQRLDPKYTCVSDPARGVECEPKIGLRIPIKLGPRTILYDVAFQGAKSISEKSLADAAALALGEPMNSLKLEDARRRILELYREEGYAYADVKYTIDTSSDNTHARVSFDVAEGDRVIVRQIVIRGNRRTAEWMIRRRIALEEGKPYRASDVRKTQERIATLNVFSTVNVALADPYVPAAKKTVIVTVTELVPQYAEALPGFSTGQGFRFSLSYGHRNINGSAIGAAVRIQLSYLPTPLIIDPEVRHNWLDTDKGNLGDPGLDKRLVIRATGGLTFPEIGLGPFVRAGLDGVGAHDLFRDFFLTKLSAVPSVTLAPRRDLQISIAQSFEDNYLRVFTADDTAAYVNSQIQPGQTSPPSDLVKLLNFPSGASFVSAQRVSVTWDRRDNPFNASRGTYLLSSIEHADSNPIYAPVDNVKTFAGHFIRLTETFAGYIPLFRGIRLAGEIRLGTNIQLTPTSQTYPDRMFFMGGLESMRAWSLYSFLPQDDVDRIDHDANLPDTVLGKDANGNLTQIPNPQKFTAEKDSIRGGNLMFNPRVELRIPIVGALETVVFGDVGNLWKQATYPFDHGAFPMRVAVGSGIRYQTPVGPFALDYGINLTRKPYEDFGQLNFSIGLF